MKAELKAKELVEKFKKETSYEYQEYAGANYSTFEHDKDTIIKLALICVDEILKEVSTFTFQVTYWNEVKEELNRLKNN